MTGGNITSIVMIPRLPIHQAREQIAKMFLQTKADALLCVDDDMVYTKDDLTFLMSDDVDIVCGICNERIRLGVDKTKPILFKKLADERYEFYSEEEVAKIKESDQLVEVDAGSIAFCLIKRAVFEKLGTEFNHSITMGEDIGFFDRATRAGFKIHVDNRVKIGHIKEVII